MAKLKPVKKNAPPAPPKKSPWVIAGLALAILALVIVFQPSLVAPPAPARPASNSVHSSSATNVEPTTVQAGHPDRPVGNGVRPDGGYVLEIRSATADGKLAARYLNPSPINVARAEWQQKEGKLHVFVELRDVNYPGSPTRSPFSPLPTS